MDTASATGLVQSTPHCGITRQQHVRLTPVRQVRFEIPLIRKEIEEQGAAYRYALIRSEVMLAPDWLRARLSLKPGTEVLHLVCMHFADGRPYQLEDRWINLAATPQGRTGKAGELADVAAFLLSDAASHVTGQSLAVDGGVLGTLRI